MVGWEYTFLMTSMLIIIIIGLLVYNYYYFLLYTRFHSSPVEHENLRSNVVLIGKITKFYKIHFLKCANNKISNKSCFHLPKSWFVGKRKINIKYMKKSIYLKPYHFTTSIWYGTNIHAYPIFHGNVRYPYVNLIFIQ